jgi:hypothetical protein
MRAAHRLRAGRRAARSAASSRSSSSISSGSRPRPRSSTPRTCGRSSFRTTRRVRSELESHGGKVEKFVGDAVMGVFGAPVTYGDDAERAVRAAFAVRDWADDEGFSSRRRQHGRGDRRPRRQPRARGDLRRGRRRQHCGPSSVRIAVGAVLVGEETYVGTRGSIEYRPAQPVSAKGKEAPVQAWLAVRATRPSGSGPAHASRSSAATASSGSSRHLGARRRRGEEPLRHGVRPGGIGKSRIALELAQLVAGQEARASAAAPTPYGARARTARSLSRSSRPRDLRQRRAAEATEKLAEAIASLAGAAAAEEHVPNLAVAPRPRRGRESSPTASSSSSPRACSSSRSPSVVRRCSCTRTSTGRTEPARSPRDLRARVRDVPVLFLALARPELLGERPGWGGGLPAYTALRSSRSRRCGQRARHGASRRVARDASREGRRRRPRAIRCSSRSSPVHRRAAGGGLAELPTSIRAIIAAQARRAAAAERAVLVDASVGRPGVLARRASEMRPSGDLSQVLGSLEARDLVQREAVSTDPRRSAVRLQARADPRRRRTRRSRVRPAARSTRRSRASRGDDRRRPVARGARPPLARGGRERPRRRAPRRRGRPGGRGWAKQRAVLALPRSLELLGEDDCKATRHHAKPGGRPPGRLPPRRLSGVRGAVAGSVSGKSAGDTSPAIS